MCNLDHTLALECGLVFHAPDQLREAHLANGRDLSKTFGNNSWLLPTPATYIVRPDGMIAHAYINPDIRNRLEPRHILAAPAKIARAVSNSQPFKRRGVALTPGLPHLCH